MNSESAKLSAVVPEVGPGQDPAEELKQFEEDDRREQHSPTALLATEPTLEATPCFFHSSIGSH